MRNCLNRYPNTPGYKRTGTSKQAALSMSKVAQILKAQVLRVLRRKNCTTDEAARSMHRDILSVRPRFSELYRARQIQKTKKRRPNRSGKLAIVWRIRRK
mgnify:CR=1 FL=1